MSRLFHDPLPRLEDPMPSLPDAPGGSVIDEDDFVQEREEEVEQIASTFSRESGNPQSTPPKSPLHPDDSVVSPSNEPQELPLVPMVKPKTRRYRSSRPINSGGMGEIFLVRDERLNRDIAAKVLNSRFGDDPRARARFSREVSIISRLQHPGIVTVYDCGRCHDGRPFYMMQFIDGRTLDQVIREYHTSRNTSASRGEQRVLFRKLLAMVVEVCNAVGYMHSQGYLHRDLKPANVMVGSYGETILIDLGLAKNFDDRREERAEGSLADIGPEFTRDGSILGTPEYMSPEQAAGSVYELREPSDIYSLGAILYKVLTGSMAIHPAADYHVTLAYVLQGQFDPPRKLNPDIPRDLEAIVLKAMALDPQDRYASATALAEDIRLWLADEPVTARRPSLLERLRRWIGRRRTLVLGPIRIQC